MFGAPFVEFLQRVAVAYHHDWFDVRRALSVDRMYSPIEELLLFGSSHDEARVFELLKLTDDLSCTEHVSTRPIHDGFIAALEIVPGTGTDTRDRVREFLRREGERDVEQYVKGAYARDAFRDHAAFRFMDFPAFDNGDGTVGFGLMVERGRAKRWLWSRVAFAHK